MSDPGLNVVPYIHRRNDRRIIVGSSPLGTPVGGYDLTAGNFPSLNEAFISTGISGNNLVGVLGTVTAAASSGWESPGVPPDYPAGAFRPVTGSSITSSGTWTAPDGKHMLLISVGYHPSSGGTFNIGGTATTYPRLENAVGAESANVAFNSTNRVTFPTSGLSDCFAICVSIDQRTAAGAGTRTILESDGVTVISQAGTIVGDVSQSWGSFPVGVAKMIFPNNALGTDPYLTGAYLLTFDSYPSVDIGDALIWMNNNPQKLYPGFKGLR